MAHSQVTASGPEVLWFQNDLFQKIISGKLSERQVTLNLQKPLYLNPNTTYNASSSYLQVLKRSEFKLAEKTWGNYIFRPSWAANSIVSSGIG